MVAWSVSLGQWAAWRRLALPFLQPGPILELAYGTGGFFLDLLEAGYQPVGIDLSPYMAHLAGQRLRRSHLAIHLSQAKAQRLPFPSNYFANVVATFPTNYIFETSTLTEIYRVLMPPRAHESGSAGRLIIVVEGQLRGPWPIRPLIDWLYKITDQHDFPTIKPLPTLAVQHFDARWKTIEQRGVSARLLIGYKITNEP